DIYTNYMLPVKLLEYVTMKIPVIASQIKTIEYYFDSSQVRYFEPEDENSLAKAILDMYYNPSKRKTYSENASRFEKKYNWEQQKRIYFRLVKKLLSEKS
ncbi:glycosyltransferase, partial [candidate division WOR-3 bacterium]|nr:glycosyltransferase [candidate division WOR-3 bacterium]